MRRTLLLCLLVASCSPPERSEGTDVAAVLVAGGFSFAGTEDSANLGYATASAGDINGDGYADVIIGAPDHPGGGRVYAFHGSAAGLSATPNWFVDSSVAGASFGEAVASAGDVNGDGFGDVIIGAPGFDGGQMDEGRVAVYLGSALGLASTPVWTFESDQAFARLGSAVGAAGDVNKDQFSDVAVGAARYNAGQTAEGRVWVFSGSAAGPTGTPWTAESDQANAEFGWSLAPAGDVNADGFSDLVVGARHFTNGQTEEGRVYVYLGSAAGLGSTPMTAELDQANATLGWAVAPAGDVNGDGFADVIATAPNFDGGLQDEGRAVVYLGSASGLVAGTWSTEGEQAGAMFGYAAGSVGDANGDGFADVIVSAAHYTGDLSSEGKAWLYLGSASGLGSTAVWSAEGDQQGAWFGTAAAAAGDVDGDGFGDVIVGAELYDNGAKSDAGLARLFRGGASAPASIPAWTATRDQAAAGVGESVAAAGDVNGDGFGDVIVGAPRWDGGQLDEGAAFLLLGSATGLAASPAWTEEIDQAGAAFGQRVAGAGDVNGDGFADVLVGSTSTGYVYLGSSGGLATTAVWSKPGASLASAGDVNGDGLADILVGASAASNGETGEGTATLYLGSASGPSAAPGWTDEGNQAGAGFGSAVARAGDVNGDGFGDVAIGAPGHDGAATDAGRVQIYLGSASGLAQHAAVILDGGPAGGSFGAAIAPAGDVDGDGFADVIVGAPGEGRAYLYRGTSSGLGATPAWSATSDQGDAGFGAAVSSAGDVNGDGYGDVWIGAPAYDAGQIDEGRAFLHLGSNTGLAAAASFTAESDQPGARFGADVAPAGDVDGDGFADFIAGAPAFDDGQSDEGSVEIFAGSARGRVFVAQARRLSTATPIAPYGASPALDAFDVVLRAAGHAGRARLKLAVEAKPLGQPFNGTGVVTTSAFGDIGTTVPLLTRQLAGLSRDTGYHWRARLLYDPTLAIAQGTTRWILGGVLGDARGVHTRTCPNVDKDTLCDDADADDDGDGALDTNDCRPRDPESHPGATEIVGDGIDQNCDGAEQCFADGDGDGFSPGGTVASTDTDCDDPGEAGAIGDCDDADGSVYPDAPEMCDAVDSDCDGDYVDELPECDAGVVDPRPLYGCSIGGAAGFAQGMLVLLALTLLRRRALRWRLRDR